MDLYTNTSDRRDFFINAFSGVGFKPCDVYIATAFFTYQDPLIQLRERGYRVKIIVRLGYPTKPEALKKISNREGIQVRFVNDRSFHPKLYIFAGNCAIVGSSNLTEAALKTNQEVNVVLESADPRYEDLVSLFVDWWDQSKVLDSETLEQYSKIYDKYRTRHDNENIIEDEIQKKQGRVTIQNIKRGLKKPSKSEIWLDQYRSDYQEFLDAYKTVQRIYKNIGRRRYDESQLPLRLEIDSFFSFVREKKATKKSYLDVPILHGEEQENKILSNINEWFDAEWKWLDNEIVPKRYPAIQRILGSPESIGKATMDDIVEALSSCHSFFDSLRFYLGGHETHVKEFKETNELKQVKATITYLLFGKGDFIRRMGRCIYDPAYKLNRFGQSNVQELLGWVNDEDIPVCNNRTLRSVRWLGFDVKLVGG